MLVDTDGAATQRALSELARTGKDVRVVCIAASIDTPANQLTGTQLALLATERWGPRVLDLATGLVAMGTPGTD